MKWKVCLWLKETEPLCWSFKQDLQVDVLVPFYSTWNRRCKLFLPLPTPQFPILLDLQLPDAYFYFSLSWAWRLFYPFCIVYAKAPWMVLKDLGLETWWKRLFVQYSNHKPCFCLIKFKTYFLNPTRHMWLMATALDGTDIKHSLHCRKLYRTALL